MNSKETMKGVLAHIGIPWDPQVLNFHMLNRTVLTNSNMQVNKPLYHHSIGKWEKYATFLRPAAERLHSLFTFVNKMGVGLPFLTTMNWNMSLAFKYKF